MSAVEALHRGDLDGALAALKDEIRSAPEDAKHRVFLFQLLAIMGDWDRSLTQLNVAGDLDPETMLMAKTYQELLNCEVLRQEVFAGRRSPMLLGEPTSWMAKAIEAQKMSAQGDYEAAKAMRDDAWDDAPPTAGKATVQSGDNPAETIEFQWIADCDTRLGPVLEAIVNGRYYWVPFEQISRIEIDPPTDLRDFVWTPARFTWTNEGQAPGMIPTRYAGSEADSDAEVRLARKTSWRETGHEGFEGVGQRLLATDAAEIPLLNLRLLELS
mgnify:CR=1 FL=1